MPKVTVITGYYNREDTLDLTINSIMNQTYHDFEFIIFNDCSTDGTKTKLEKIKESYNDKRLKVINFDNNVGFVGGLIHCIALAEGELICIQGSGDYSYPDRLEKQVSAFIENQGVVLVGCYYENYIEEKNLARLRHKVSDLITKEDLLEDNYFSHGEVMFKKYSYDKVGGYRAFFKYCQDYDLWLRMIEVGSFFTVKHLLYRRFVRSDGVSYEPNKFLKQVRYSQFCVKLNSLKPDEQVSLLKEAECLGIDKVVDIKEQTVQYKIFKAVLRSIVWENHVDADKLIHIGINNRILKFVLRCLNKVYSKPFFSYLKTKIHAYIGVNYSK